MNVLITPVDDPLPDLSVVRSQLSVGPATGPRTLDLDRDSSVVSGQWSVVSAAGPKTLIVDLSGDHGFAFPAKSAQDPSTGGQFSPGDEAFSRIVLFLPFSANASFMEVIDRCVSIATRSTTGQVFLVSSFRAHFGDRELAAWEDSVSRRFEDAAADPVIIRAGNVVDRHGGCPKSWSRFAVWYPLVPATLTSVFLSRDELLSAIDQLAKGKSGAHRRQLTLLGRNRLLRDVLAESESPGLPTRFIGVLARVLSWLQIGGIAGLILSAAGRFYLPLQRWQVSTLRPATVSELLALYHPLNQRHVALAGYNTGVTHFGWKYPGRTVVSTIASGRLVRIGEKTVTVDAGVLLKEVIGALAARGKELCVVPNYSYISMGTAFMVPVHGSGCEVSTLGDSIEKVLIYDPGLDRILCLRRGDERFSRFMYDSESGVLVLRLRLRIRDKSRYFVKRSRLTSPAAADIWRIFSDREASNIELRKSRAADDSVEVSRYFTTATDDQEALEVPRDSIGRLWDRLEENLISSWLFHGYVRKFGYHVELFLNEPEFDIFWQSHAGLPLSKLQLRLVKCDGLSHSPFGDGDRISVDIFMKRRDSARFLSFIKEHLPHARFNRGKHSM
jgi:hypothetical protein